MSVEQGQAHLDNVLFHLPNAAKCAPGTQRILGKETKKGVATHLIGLGITAKHVQRRTSATPVDIPAGQSVKGSIDLGACQSGWREGLHVGVILFVLF